MSIRPVETVDTVVVGAGHAGLAVSRLLTRAGRDHVVLDRGRIGERWRSERWDSLRLLTPNWMTRLPGMPWQGGDPDGFLPATRFADHLEHYAASFRAPVVGGTAVEAVTPLRRGTAGVRDEVRYAVSTDRGVWRARNVVVATGPHGVPQLPAGWRSSEVTTVTSDQYRRPDALPAGGVLVVGASSSGTQIADELARAGRDVVLAVGRHTRMPRSYRGMDIFWWLQATGRLARTVDDVPDRERARREPSMQLVGRPAASSHARLDLPSLHARGVTVTGRLLRLDHGTAAFGEDLDETTAASDRTMYRLLDAVDHYAHAVGLDAELLPADRPAPCRLPDPADSIDLKARGISTVVLATGFRPDQSFVRLPVFGPGGAIAQYRGVTRAPGLYVVGQRFQHRRDSGFIAGARHTARDVVSHLTTGSTHASRDVDEEVVA
jgi:putative flavoprotein involved in K+ transport